MTLIAQLKVGMSPLLPPQHHGVVLVELDRVAKVNLCVFVCSCVWL